MNRVIQFKIEEFMARFKDNEELIEYVREYTSKNENNIQNVILEAEKLADKYYGTDEMSIFTEMSTDLNVEVSDLFNLENFKDLFETYSLKLEVKDFDLFILNIQTNINNKISKQLELNEVEELFIFCCIINSSED